MPYTQFVSITKMKLLKLFTEVVLVNCGGQ